MKRLIPLPAIALGICLACVARAQDQDEPSLDDLRTHTTPDFPLRERIEAIRTLAGVGWRRIISEKSTPEDAQWFAEEITPTLLALLDDPNREVRYAVVRALGGPFSSVDPSHTPPEALPKLMKCLADADAEIRRVATGDIVAIRPVPEKEIAQLLDHKDDVIRRAAATAVLYNCPRQPSMLRQFQARMIQIVNSDDQFSRKNAQLLSRLGAETVPTLLKLLEDDNPNMRSNAAYALAGLGPAAKNAVSALKRHLTDMAEVQNNDLDHRVCHSAAEALNSILHDKNYLEGLPKKRPDGL